ncbi:ATP-binding protein, partial [candidate division KSB1 bacterium]
MHNHNPERVLRNLTLFSWIISFSWSVVVILSFIWLNYSEDVQSIEVAKAATRISIEKDIIYRRWTSVQGGVYVPATDQTQPNPYLDTAERDILKPSGQLLTLINPAFMIRLVEEMSPDSTNISGRIISLKPINPSNVADEWETNALKSFEKGATEAGSVEMFNGQAQYRYMLPLVTEESCLTCHAEQGYQVGSIRGGLSVAMPMAPLWEASKKQISNMAIAHSLLWFIGILGIFIGTRKVRNRMTEHEIEVEQAEQKLKEYQADLEATVIQRTAELQKAKDIAEAANKSKSVFLVNMTHEIRTPMNSIMGFSELLEGTEIDSQQKEYLRSIKKNGSSLLSLIIDVLDLSKAESGDLELEYSEVNLHSLISGINNEFSNRTTEKGIEYIQEKDEELPKYIITDQARLRQVLVNVLGNAVKFTSKGHVKLSLSGKNHDLQNSVFDLTVTVEDTGIGIPEKHLESIFDALTQHHGEDEYKYGGTGMGLAIADRILKKMNGEISVKSTVGKGSVFRIELKEVKITETPEDTAEPEEITAETETVEELGSETQEELSSEIIQKLPELLETLSKEYRPEWEELKDTLPIDEIEEFAGKIINVGTE